MAGIVETDQLGLDGWRGKLYQWDESVLEVELVVEPEIVFHIVVGRTIGGAHFESVRSLDPGEVIFKLVTLLVRNIGHQRRASESRGAPQSADVEVAKAEVHPGKLVGQIVGHVARHNLNQDLIHQRWADGLRPGAQNG